MIRFDTIKAMSITELAEFLTKPISSQADKYHCGKCKAAHNNQCPFGDIECPYTAAESIREWLMQEVEG